MNLKIVKYNAGNIRSVLNALDRLGITAEVTDDKESLQSADKVIFPGVGAAGSAMESLRASGLDIVIRDLKQPVLGICVGMQLLCERSEESNTDCLGIVPVTVRRFTSPARDIKVPQVGWNRIHHLRSPLFEGVPENSFVYNVHSYYVEDSPFTIATCNYGVPYAAALRKDNFYGVQFHAEKSAEAGDQILRNFIERA